MIHSRRFQGISHFGNSMKRGGKNFEIPGISPSNIFSQCSSWGVKIMLKREVVCCTLKNEHNVFIALPVLQRESR